MYVLFGIFGCSCPHPESLTLRPLTTRTLSSSQALSAAAGALMILTLYNSYPCCGCARRAAESDLHAIWAHLLAHTRASTSNNCNGSDIWCVMPCRLCLFVVGLIICCWLAPLCEHPITHPTYPLRHTHTHSSVIKVWKQGCLFIEEALSTLHPLTQQSQHNTTVNCIGHALWLGLKWGVGGRSVFCLFVRTHALPSPRLILPPQPNWNPPRLVEKGTQKSSGYF